ncbi:MAG: 16S rRNA (adenine(1518)-N(6)/adenine(1519)-N(6))-dimethyltransferase RsmA [Candidatus Komeilibacteria bacterium]|nr:16S rRNA (adenine(1518)-N(6)/adenine(1519)-N(6))-dimethyltransferase RsmA [Candidatus Komeilibacteria bacterium]
MDLLQQTQYLIKNIGLRPDKLKGQNFCIDEKVLQAMVKAARAGKNDTVLEVGAGFGFLTTELAKIAKEVVAVEIEPALVRILRNLQAVYKNVEVVQGDILKIQNLKLKAQNYKIVANLPYSITSAFLRKFLTTENKPSSITLLLQREVAQRICAQPGEMSLLAVSVQLYGEPKIISTVKPASFWPRPSVNSAILQINDLQPFPFQKQVSELKFWQVVRAGFCAKRKTLENNLANSFHLSKEDVQKSLINSGLNPLVRAQELSLDDWLKLTTSFN